MKKIKVNLNELVEAFVNCAENLHNYLDIKTGEIIMIPISKYSDFDKENEELNDKMESDPERYIDIPEKDSREGYQEMVDFTESIDDENMREKLAIALNGAGSFRRFKDVLSNYPEERKQWYDFKDERANELIQTWLEDNELELDPP